MCDLENRRKHFLCIKSSITPSHSSNAHMRNDGSIVEMNLYGSIIQPVFLLLSVHHQRISFLFFSFLSLSFLFVEALTVYKSVQSSFYSFEFIWYTRHILDLFQTIVYNLCTNDHLESIWRVLSVKFMWENASSAFQSHK